jgi:hypothetical protein
MNDLTIVLTFVLAMLVLFASLPPKRAYVAAKCFRMVIGVLPISKICEAVIEYFNSKKKSI